VRLVALLVVVVILAVLGVVVFNAVTDSTEDTLAILTTTTTATTAAGGAGLPGPGGQPIVLETVPQAVSPGVGGVLDAAKAAACKADRPTMEAAVEAYTGLEGSAPADEQALIAAGLLKEASVYWDVKDGVLVPQDPACA
jgi:hypothetical protein